MYSLVLETSSLRGLFAIIKDDKVLFKHELSFGVRESNELVPAIEMGFNEINLSINDIETIILGRGPGSFTGLRIGASVAKAFSYAKSIPIMTVDSLKCLAPAQEGPFAILLDAKAKGIFIQKGLKEHNQVYFEDQYKVISIKEIEEEIKDKTTLITAHKATFSTKLPKKVYERLLEESPNPDLMLKMALKKPKTTLHNAQDVLDLEYFNSP
ncbi:MAG: hypothetical protein S4CHLAM6_00390 [Chlamydiae bacterium]|nr:hypothetical protein [Chlamydiota bacterium]